jgi:hypothetical protein
VLDLTGGHQLAKKLLELGDDLIRDRDELVRRSKHHGFRVPGVLLANPTGYGTDVDWTVRSDPEERATERQRFTPAA